MNRTLILSTFVAVAAGCASAIHSSAGSPGGATENALMQADRDFATATHAHGIDGWMSFYAPDAIRIRYRGNMVKGFDEIRKFDSPYISDTTNLLNWEPTDAPRAGCFGAVVIATSITGDKKPRTLSGTGLATGGPPVLQALPVAPSSWAGETAPVLNFLDSPYGQMV